MLKVSITKLGKKVRFNNTTFTTPCKFFIEDKDVTAMKVVLMTAGINEKFFTIEKVEKNPEADEARIKAEKAVLKEAEKIAKEVKNESPVVEEKKEDSVQNFSKKNKKH